MVLVFILYFVWSLMLFASKEVMSHCAHPLFVGGLQSLFAGILLVLYTFVFQGARLKPTDLSAVEWKKLLACAVMLYSFAASGFVLGIDYINPIMASFIYSVAPFMTAGFLYFLYNQALSVKKMTGLLIGSVGVLTIILGNTGASEVRSSWYGVIIFLISMFLYCYGWIIFKSIIERREKKSLLLNGMAMIVGGGIALFYSVACKVPDSSMRLLFVDHGPLVAVFLLLTAIGYGLYAQLLTKHSPTFLSFAGFLDPAFGTLLGVLFFGYSFHIIFIFSLIALFVGLYLFYKEELELSSIKGS